MYHGKTASEPDDAGKLFMALNIAQAEKDLRGAAKFLAEHSSTPKIGVVGFCMGGQLALFAATLNPTVGACVNFYASIHSQRNTPSSRRPRLFAEIGFVTQQTARTSTPPSKGRSSRSHIYHGVDQAFFQRRNRPRMTSPRSSAWSGR